MAGSDATAGAKERVFKFILDPKHKENLSGRVQAACLTCRRKKTKCSGEVNCRPCRDKGLLCEGIPERKVSRRDSGVSLTRTSVGTGAVEQTKKVARRRARRRLSISTDRRGSTSTISSNCFEPSSMYRVLTTKLEDLAGIATASNIAATEAESHDMLTEEPDLSHSCTTDEDSSHSLSPALLGNESWSWTRDVKNEQDSLMSASDAGQLRKEEEDETPVLPASTEWARKHTSTAMWEKHLDADPIGAFFVFNMNCARGDAAAVELPSSLPPSLPSEKSRRQRHQSDDETDLHQQAFDPPIDVSCQADACLVSRLPDAVPECTRVEPDPAALSWWDISADMNALLGRGLLLRGQADCAALDKPAARPCALSTDNDVTAWDTDSFDAILSAMDDFTARSSHWQC